ncbi:MAG: hypothetical protein M0R74_17895 [Dehalococcoidia bacterium]|jgi:hypothetical protein|nr:hypothetical protein [Dehalococcoidia bacterium]
MKELLNFRDNADLRYAVKHLRESNLNFHGHVFTDHFRDGRLIHTCDQGGNTFTTEGMAYLLNIIFGTTSKTGSAIFYVGIFKNNVTPAVGDTAAAKLGAAGAYGECQDADYDSPATDKPSYTIATTSTATCTNAASPASFTIAGSITVYGAFLSTSKAKTATDGYLMCAKKFSASRAVIDDDVLSVTYVITATTS